ncbi:MAG: hypothetical protein Q7V14_02170 [Coriobacteriia bacterium]|nr:hypothetical protein [Coriobacteriia bacterium]
MGEQMRLDSQAASFIGMRAVASLLTAGWFAAVCVGFLASLAATSAFGFLLSLACLLVGLILPTRLFLTHVAAGSEVRDGVLFVTVGKRVVSLAPERIETVRTIGSANPWIPGEGLYTPRAAAVLWPIPPAIVVSERGRAFLGGGHRYVIPDAKPERTLLVLGSLGYAVPGAL